MLDQRLSASLILALSVACFVVGCAQQPIDGVTIEANERTDIARLAALAEELAELDRSLAAPREGSWRSHFPDPGSNFSAWQRRHSDARERAPDAIRLLIVGNVSEASAAEAKAWLEAFIGRPVIAGEDIAAPPGMIDERSRLNAPRFLRESLPMVRADSHELVVALTDIDLWPGPGFDHVLGQSDPGVRTVVVSTRRLGGDTLARQRMLKILAHESAHAIGLDHEGLVACLMNGAASVEEVDAVPQLLSARSLPKLLWALELDAANRDQKIRTSAMQLGLESAVAAIDRRRPIIETGPRAANGG